MTGKKSLWGRGERGPPRSGQGVGRGSEGGGATKIMHENAIVKPITLYANIKILIIKSYT